METIATSPLSALRRFAAPRKQVERCELCGKGLSPHHQHLLEPPTRKIFCSCDACSMLFDSAGARYRRIPHRIERLVDFRMTDAHWESLHLPINLAFFFHSTPAKQVIALFPSPAGATESHLTESSWADLVADNTALLTLEHDVEALLVNRIGKDHEYWLVPIDECFALVGILRTHWRGLSGGTEVWREITAFYQSLQQRSTGARNA